MQWRLIKPALALVTVLTVWDCNSQKQPEYSATPAAEYTKTAPGQWQGLEETHAPRFEYKRQQATSNLLVYVMYDAKTPNHYVEKMGIMDEEKKDVTPPVNFGRGQTTVQNFFTIESFRYAREKNWKVYVKCNLHDLWTREIKDED